MEKLDSVRKRDGRIVPFDKRKISEAIFKAAQSVGGQDRYLADDLAEVVRLYLVREYKGDIPSVEDIQDVVERILIKTGHAKTAKSYILYRQKRARARKIREGIRPEDLSERQQERAESVRGIELPVRRSDNNISLWDKNRVIAALVKETGISENIAEIIVNEVEEEVIASKVTMLSSSLIRELVNAKLVQYGFEKERRKHARIGLPLYDVKCLFKESIGSPDTLSLNLGRAVKREFALNSVFPDWIVEKHLRGEATLLNIEGIDRCFSANVLLSASVGKYVDAVKKSCNIWRSLVEGDIILRLPAEGALEVIEMAETNYCGGTFKLALPFKGVSEKLLQGATKQKIPLVFRIEDRNDLEQFIATGRETSQGYKVTVSRTDDRSILVLNRVVFNLALIKSYAEQEGMKSEDYMESFIPLCSETLQRQREFFSETFAGRELLKNSGSVQETVEIELSGASFPEADAVTGSRFLKNVLKRALSLVVKVPQTGETKKRFYSLLFSLMEQASDYKITVRVENV
jgi:transcriptional regulator NrdR family protein